MRRPTTAGLTFLALQLCRHSRPFFYRSRSFVSQPALPACRMASCVHKWAQAASWREQRFLTEVPGFVMFVAQAVLYTKVCRRKAPCMQRIMT